MTAARCFQPTAQSSRPWSSTSGAPSPGQHSTLTRRPSRQRYSRGRCNAVHPQDACSARCPLTVSGFRSEGPGTPSPRNPEPAIPSRAARAISPWQGVALADRKTARATCTLVDGRRNGRRPSGNVGVRDAARWVGRLGRTKQLDKRAVAARRGADPGGSLVRGTARGCSGRRARRRSRRRSR